MRTTTILKPLALSILFTLVTNFCFADIVGDKQPLNDVGGSGTGGGHEIETNFKTKTLALANELLDYDKAALAVLTFKPIEIVANLSLPGRFQANCATGEALKILVDNQKMAYVGALPKKSKNIISLDCRDEKISEWNRLFASDAPGDNLLFIHEAVRNNNANNKLEDALTISSSYLEARKIEDRKGQLLIRELLFPTTTNARCVIDDAYSNMRFKVDDVFIWSSNIHNQYRTNVLEAANGIHDNFNGSSFNDFYYFYKTLLKLARENSCDIKIPSL